MNKFIIVATLLSLSACVSAQKNNAQEIPSKLGYTRAFQRVLDGVQKCYYAYAIQSDLHMDKQKGEISFGSENANDVHLIVSGQQDKTSVISISDSSFVPQVASWLNNHPDCGK